MNGRTKYPLYSTGHCPSGAAALLTIGKSEIKGKQGKGTADHILTLVDYSLSFQLFPLFPFPPNAFTPSFCSFTYLLSLLLPFFLFELLFSALSSFLSAFLSALRSVIFCACAFPAFGRGSRWLWRGWMSRCRLLSQRRRFTRKPLARAPPSHPLGDHERARERTRMGARASTHGRTSSPNHESHAG